MSRIAKSKLKSIIRTHLERGGIVRVERDWEYVELTSPEDAEFISKQHSNKEGQAIVFVGWRVWDRENGRYVTNTIRYRPDLEKAMAILGDNSDGNYVPLEWDTVLGFRNVCLGPKNAFIEWCDAPMDEE